MDKDLQLAIEAYQMMYATEKVEQIDEEAGDGYIGPARLGIKNPMASDATRAAADQKRKQQAAAAVKSGQRPTLGGAGSYANQFDAIRSELKQSYEPEGEEIDEGKKSFPFKKVEKQMEKARKGSVYGRNTGNEPAPNVSDKEKKETGRFSKMHQASEKAKREKQVSDKSSRSSTFYRDTHPASAPKMKKANESVDLFDTILEYLVAEGYADTNESALVIMANMSEEWRQEIVEAFVDPEHGEAPSGRSPLQNVSDHPKASVRKKAVKGFKKQMGKEYGGKWKSRTDDPTG